MRPEAFETVDVRSGPEGLPLQSSQQSSRRSGIVRLTLLTGLAAAVVLPQLALAVHAIALPGSRAMILAHPMLALDLALAIGFWIALFSWPLKRLAGRVNWRREIEISDGCVAVHDHKAFSYRAWSAPLKSYSGIAHHMRASLSGTRHELILVHPERDRSVLLMVSEHISTADIARFSSVLGLPEVSAKELYGRRRVQPIVRGAPDLVAVAA